MFNHSHHHRDGREGRHDRGCGPRFMRHRHDGEFGREGRGARGWGRPGGRRPFEQGDLRWLALDLIAEQPRHGYEIIKAVEEALGGHYSPSPGVIYPTLTLLDETGFIAGEAQGSKKLYTLTPEGRAELASHADEVAAVRARLGEARARFGGEPPPEVRRALHNLRSALQVRLGKGELSPEAVRAVTDALDRAAREVEGG